MISLRADLGLVRSDTGSRRHIAVSIQAPEAPPGKARLPVNLAFVIDRSGSMHGEKLDHARKAVVAGVRSLVERDRFAVVTYDDAVEVVVPGVEATAPARQRAAYAVERVEARGSTDLHGGWTKGCELVKTHLAAQAVGRCLLLTDGLANRGETDHDEIVRQCAGWRDQGVVTTAFGVGADFDETLLRRMADTGGGNFQFIASAAQITDFVASEVGEALATTVREGVVVVEAGEDAVVESLNDFPCRREGRVWRIPFGSLYSGQPLQPLLSVTFPAGDPGRTRDVVVRVEDKDDALGRATASLRFTWASGHEIDRAPRDSAVDRQAALLDAARAERDALERNRRGDYDGARRAIETGLGRIREYAGDDAEIRQILADLEKKQAWYEREMDPMASKSHHSISSRTLGGRLLEHARQKALQMAQGSSGSLIVPSEWDVQAAIASALAKVVAGFPPLAGLDVKAVAASLAHLDRKGCLLDHKTTAGGELELLLQAPDLCRACRSALDGLGLSVERIALLVEGLRLLGAVSGVVH